MKKIFLAMAIAIVTGTAVSAQDDDKEDKIVVSTHQTDKEDGYEGCLLYTSPSPRDCS